MGTAQPPSWGKAIGGCLGSLVLVSVVFGLTASGEDDAKASRHALDVKAGDFAEWPFTVQSGTLRCRDGSVTFATGGQEYGVNGRAQDSGYPKPLPIWAADPSLGHGLRVGIGEVLNKGLSLC